MTQVKDYFLLMDPRVEVLSLQEAALRRFYGGDICASTSTDRAYEVLQTRGHPAMIIIDSELVSENDSQFYRHLETEKINVPVIATVTGADTALFAGRFPSITAVIEKPTTATAFTDLVKGLTKSPLKNPSHVPLKTSMLLRMGVTLFDLYLKLSETNFVKIIHKSEMFFDGDAQKLADKGIQELFIKYEDSEEFLRYLEQQIVGDKKDSVEDLALTLENVESFERVARYLKWSPAVLLSAQSTVGQAVKILSKNHKVVSILKKKLADPSASYTQHVGLLTYLVCAFSANLGWVGESGQIKLALAALIHDAAVDEEYYDNINEWNKRAKDFTDKSPETIKYRMHPYEASKIARSLDSVSADVDQIILQHHESKDGTGFPRAMDHVHIGHLPALFIIVEDLVEFIGNGENLETSLTDFLMWGQAKYDAGHFKKIFAGFEEGLKPVD